VAQAKYITVAELVETHDTRPLGQLSSDSGAAATVDENNAKLLNAIERASADVESHALRGGRYSSTDLTDLQTADDWTLKGLVARLAIYYVYRRRGGPIPPDVESDRSSAKLDLEALRDGKMIFSDAGAIGAGRARPRIVSSGIRGELHLASDEPYFPQRRTSAV